MSFDTSRYNFDPRSDYRAVVMEQGRVQLDSDWNAWLAQLDRRTRAGTLDTIGRAAYPATTPTAFQISFDGAGALKIGAGRMYVDGLLAENHGDPATEVWDPALEELSNSPQPPGSPIGAIGFTDQPYYSPLGPGAALPVTGTYLAYLDVWTRAVDYLEDPKLIDAAISIDTTGRLQTVWQVRLAEVPADTTCGNAGAPWPAASGGRLTTAPITSDPSGPCCLTDNTGYTGPENQHYRVEVQKGGPIGTATVKWSRDNASVETGVIGIAAVTNSVNAAASQLSVLSMGRDQVLGFRPGDWIEILDDELELAGLPGELHRIDTIDFAGRTITLDAPVSAASFPAPNNAPDPVRHTRIRRWDQAGKVYQSDGTTVVTDLGAAGSAGDIPIPPAGTAFILEYGITVAFDLAAAGDEFNAGDFWTFAARTDGSIELLDKAAPRGIHHHYVPLAVVDFSSGTATDCRVPWHPGTDEDSTCGCCCTVTVGDGIQSVGQYTSINAALAALPTHGGEVCILPGRYYEYVLVAGKRDIVIRGCGYQTRLASPIDLQEPNLAAARPADSSPMGGNADGTFNAIVTITASQHIILRDFAVEAADNEVGVLIDGTGALVPNPQQPVEVLMLRQPEIMDARAAILPLVIDVTVTELFLTGSTLPAILALRVQLLHVDDNRVLMRNVRSLWPSIYVGGIEMHIDRNFVGIQSAAVVREWLPANVAADLAGQEADDPALAFEKVAEHPGGILIAGRSRSVFVSENLIQGGRFNGITLGSYTVLDANGGETIVIIGLGTEPQDPCCNDGSLNPPIVIVGGGPGSTIVAGGPLIDIVIDRNRIYQMGLCGIGPIGLFDLEKMLEIISIENLTITNNDIRDTVLLPTAPLTTFGMANTGRATKVSPVDTGGGHPYAAILVPDVVNLVIHDNAVTNFGNRPGVPVNGIYVIHGEGVEISRNHVIETRDWDSAGDARSAGAGGLFGGIVLVLVTPPTLNGGAFGKLSATNSYVRPIYEPGLPALRVEENVVRVALGTALLVIGLGPFAIADNHFTCGGMVLGNDSTLLAQTVLIANLGAAIETAAQTTFGSTYGIAKGATTSPFTFGGTATVERTFALSQNGTVLFDANICQLETRVDQQRSVTSVCILSRDHVNFTSNHCWVDAPPGDDTMVFTDALIVAGSVNVTANRFQEEQFAVKLSGITIAVANVTAQNISTYCLLIKGLPALTVNAPNVALINGVAPGICERLNAL